MFFNFICFIFLLQTLKSQWLAPNFQNGPGDVLESSSSYGYKVYKSFEEFNSANPGVATTGFFENEKLDLLCDGQGIPIQTPIILDHGSIKNTNIGQRVFYSTDEYKEITGQEAPYGSHFDSSINLLVGSDNKPVQITLPEFSTIIGQRSLTANSNTFRSYYSSSSSTSSSSSSSSSSTNSNSNNLVGSINQQQPVIPINGPIPNNPIPNNPIPNNPIPNNPIPNPNNGFPNNPIPNNPIPNNPISNTNTNYQNYGSQNNIMTKNVVGVKHNVGQNVVHKLAQNVGHNVVGITHNVGHNVAKHVVSAANNVITNNGPRIPQQVVGITQNIMTKSGGGSTQYGGMTSNSGGMVSNSGGMVSNSGGMITNSGGLQQSQSQTQMQQAQIQAAQMQAAQRQAAQVQTLQQGNTNYNQGPNYGNPQWNPGIGQNNPSNLGWNVKEKTVSENFVSQLTNSEKDHVIKIVIASSIIVSILLLITIPALLYYRSYSKKKKNNKSKEWKSLTDSLCQ